jgi:hypothetical protein
MVRNLRAKVFVMTVMRTLNAALQTPMGVRLFRPWVIGTAGGLCIGIALLNLASQQNDLTSIDLPPRAAVYEPSARRTDLDQAASVAKSDVFTDQFKNETSSTVVEATSASTETSVAVELNSSPSNTDSVPRSSP